MRLSERKLAILTGVFFAVAMTNVSQNGDAAIAFLARMADQPQFVADTSAPQIEAQSRDNVAAREADGRQARQPAVPDSAGIRTGAMTDPNPRRSPTMLDLSQIETGSIIDSPADLADKVDPILTFDPEGGALMLPRDVMLPAATLPDRMSGLPARVAALQFDPTRPISDAQRALSPYGMPCSISLAASVRPGALVSVTLDAPCHPRSRVEISHDGLAVASRTNIYGGLHVLVPAMARQARIVARLPSGQTASIVTHVPDMDRIQRVALQWRGSADLDLHALEFGATGTDTGHVWAGNARSADHAVRVGGGFLTVLGDPDVADPMMAEVYTLPMTDWTPAGTVRMEVEASAEDDDCAVEIDAMTLIRAPGAENSDVGLRFALPPCGGKEPLVLKNAVPDLKIARN